MNEIWERVLANSFSEYISPKLFAVRDRPAVAVDFPT
jgi:hypothetical protein